MSNKIFQNWKKFLNESKQPEPLNEIHHDFARAAKRLLEPETQYRQVINLSQDAKLKMVKEIKQVFQETFDFKTARLSLDDMSVTQIMSTQQGNKERKMSFDKFVGELVSFEDSFWVPYEKITDTKISPEMRLIFNSWEIASQKFFGFISVIGVYEGMGKQFRPIRAGEYMPDTGYLKIKFDNKSQECLVKAVPKAPNLDDSYLKSPATGKNIVKCLGHVIVKSNKKTIFDKIIEDHLNRYEQFTNGTIDAPPNVYRLENETLAKELYKRGILNASFQSATANAERINLLYNKIKTLTNYGKSKDDIEIPTKSEYKIIISKHPIDVIKMSDWDELASCHSQPGRFGDGGEYFQSAIEEMVAGGKVAYVVLAADLDEEYSEDEYQSKEFQIGEIFDDECRGIDGLSPISRLRFRDYIKYNEDDEVVGRCSIPYQRRVYGRDIFGIYESLKEFALKEQAEEIEKVFGSMNPSHADYSVVAIGGSYVDDDLEGILKNFFDNPDFTMQNKYGVRDFNDSKSEAAEIFGDWSEPPRDSISDYEAESLIENYVERASEDFISVYKRGYDEVTVSFTLYTYLINDDDNIEFNVDADFGNLLVDLNQATGRKFDLEDWEVDNVDEEEVVFYYTYSFDTDYDNYTEDEYSEYLWPIFENIKSLDRHLANFYWPKFLKDVNKEENIFFYTETESGLSIDDIKEQIGDHLFYEFSLTDQHTLTVETRIFQVPFGISMRFAHEYPKVDLAPLIMKKHSRMFLMAGQFIKDLTGFELVDVGYPEKFGILEKRTMILRSDFFIDYVVDENDVVKEEFKELLLKINTITADIVFKEFYKNYEKYFKEWFEHASEEVEFYIQLYSSFFEKVFDKDGNTNSEAVRENEFFGRTIADFGDHVTAKYLEEEKRWQISMLQDVNFPSGTLTPAGDEFVLSAEHAEKILRFLMGRLFSRFLDEEEFSMNCLEIKRDEVASSDPLNINGIITCKFKVDFKVRDSVKVEHGFYSFMLDKGSFIYLILTGINWWPMKERISYEYFMRLQGINGI